MLITLAAVASIFIKMDKLQTVHNVRNIEASYHTLLTVKALNENSSSDHFWLPSVTLSGDVNHNITWGATKPTASGSYIYTSFYTPSFLLATSFFNVSGLDVNLINLSYLNFLLGFVTSLLVLTLFIKTKKIKTVNDVILMALPAIIVTMFSAEALLSTGVIYWAQTVYNSIFAASLLALYIFLKKGEISNRSSGLILLLCFFGPLFEWTGFIYNIGLLLIFLFYIKDRNLAKYIFFISFLSGLFLVLHYVIALGVENTIIGFLSRFSARTINSNLLSLPYGYIKSYGLFLILFVFLFFSFVKHKKNNKIYVSIVLASLFPLIENIIMYQHASQFSFDRLKFILPLSILLFFYLCRVKIQHRYIMAFVVLVCSLQNTLTYKLMVNESTNWDVTHKNNIELVEEIKKDTDISCATIVTNSSVRGYYNLLLNRNIYEGRTLEQALELPRIKQCDLVYIEASDQLNDTITLHSYSIHKGK
ncbi:hypothetical protein [Aliivibrio finisterrensis]|uniref:Glycosyltransferase RgtA/B/C/D-like domain-containing protein n=1 Tax=Aliivibrio finisterrensis TaxID=511998 RepID=A0ABY0I592_9GAMM|nr:hypothetical protein [Aliivibrio finisterrensis]RYU59864.1 hypothetical protein ERW53_19750 [Aliivibrio finisterrensis]RYU79331.1 hypothetical protein ERW52_19595 [Aliivibrio finisterrensis]